MTDKILSAVSLVLAPFVYLISIFIPKDKTLWCFGAWFGEKYNDNSRYLYEEAAKDDDIKSVWITKRKDIVREIRKKNLNAYYCYSLTGLWCQLRAGLFFCTVNSRDFYFATLTRRAKIVQLWHGLPFKKIGFDIKNRSSTIFKNRVRAVLFDNYSYVICPSSIFEKSFCTAFNVSSRKILNCGYPRNDGLFIGQEKKDRIREILKIPPENKLILYLPTHRDEGATASVIIGMMSDFWRYFESNPEKKISIIAKPHFYDDKFFLQRDNEEDLFRVRRDFGGLDLYEILGATDGLITDYSSIFLDYEVLGLPIYFLVPDLLEYINDGRGLYFSFDKFAKKLCFDVPSLLSDIENNNSHMHDDFINEDRGGDFSRKLLEKMKNVAAIQKN